MLIKTNKLIWNNNFRINLNLVYIEHVLVEIAITSIFADIEFKLK